MMAQSTGSLHRGDTSPMSLLDMTQNKQMVKFQ